MNPQRIAERTRTQGHDGSSRGAARRGVALRRVAWRCAAWRGFARRGAARLGPGRNRRLAQEASRGAGPLAAGGNFSFAGLADSNAVASNELFRRNLSKGQTGLSVAFDLPTQTGYRH